MAARQHSYMMIDTAALDSLYDVTGELRKERRIVSGVNELVLLLPPGELLQVIHWADGAPDFPQAVHVDIRLQAFADVLGRETRPHDVRKEGRAVIEDVHAQALIMGT